MIRKYQPIVITCGDPGGVGPEVAVSAWKALRDEIPLCIIIDPNFLPKNINIKISSSKSLENKIKNFIILNNYLLIRK